MERHELLGMMKATQEKSGYVSGEAMAHMAETAGMPIGDVYGLATFYAFLSTRPLGRHVIRICKSMPCLLQGGETLMEAIGEELGIAPGETTSDGRFSFELTNCIGACDEAPAMLVDDAVYGNLTRGKVREILQSFD